MLGLHVTKTCLMPINYIICYPIVTSNLIELANILLKCSGLLFLNPKYFAEASPLLTVTNWCVEIVSGWAKVTQMPIFHSN